MGGLDPATPRDDPLRVGHDQCHRRPALIARRTPAASPFVPPRAEWSERIARLSHPGLHSGSAGPDPDAGADADGERGATDESRAVDAHPRSITLSFHTDESAPRFHVYVGRAGVYIDTVSLVRDPDPHPDLRSFRFMGSPPDGATYTVGFDHDPLPVTPARTTKTGQKATLLDYLEAKEGRSINMALYEKGVTPPDPMEDCIRSGRSTSECLDATRPKPKKKGGGKKTSKPTRKGKG
jgi:hypothetical protein